MNCDEMAAILEVSDPARAPDGARLREHLKRCAHCRERHPDVVWLLEARESERPIRIPSFVLPRDTARFKVRWVAAAALLLLAAWWGSEALKGTEKPTRIDGPNERPTRPATAAVRGRLGGDLGTGSFRIMTIDRGHRHESLTMTDVLPRSRPASTSGERRSH